jgi:cobalt transporter subunit CbtB
MIAQLVQVLPGVDRRPALIGLLGLAAFYVLAFDQGLLLSLMQGDLAYAQNLIHETLHDARHAAGFPCH